MDGCGYDKRNSQRRIWTCCSFVANRLVKLSADFEDHNKIHLVDFWIVWHAFGTAGMGYLPPLILWEVGLLKIWVFIRCSFCRCRCSAVSLTIRRWSALGGVWDEKITATPKNEHIEITENYDTQVKVSPVL